MSPLDGIIADVAAKKEPKLVLQVSTGEPPPTSVQWQQARYPDPTPYERKRAVRDLQGRVQHLAKWTNAFRPLSQAQEHAIALVFATLDFLGGIRPDSAEPVEKAFRVLGGGAPNDGAGVAVRWIAAEIDRARLWWDSDVTSGRGDDVRGHLLLIQLAKADAAFAPLKDLRAQREREYAIAAQVRRLMSGDLQMSGLVTDLIIEYRAAGAGVSRRETRSSVQKKVDRILAPLRKKASTRRVE